MNFIIFLSIAGWIGWVFVQRRLTLAKELGRFNEVAPDFWTEVNQAFNKLLSILGQQKKKDNKSKLSYLAAKSEREMNQKLQGAGLESAAERGRFILLRTLSAILGPALGGVTYLFIPAYYATLTTLATSAVGILVPIFWLKGRILGRSDAIQRELPLLLDLTNLGTSAGWDVAASLERVIDTLYVEFPDHPLMKEFKRARWLTASGYTWEEALAMTTKKLDSDSVRRTASALSQALKQGGDRSKQLQGIAEDAQRAYYNSLDKQLAKLPVKVLGITMMLMMSYFLLLLSPAVVQLKNILMK